MAVFNLRLLGAGPRRPCNTTTTPAIGADGDKRGYRQLQVTVETTDYSVSVKSNISYSDQFRRTLKTSVAQCSVIIQHVGSLPFNATAPYKSTLTYLLTVASPREFWFRGDDYTELLCNLCPFAATLSRIRKSFPISRLLIRQLYICFDGCTSEAARKFN